MGDIEQAGNVSLSGVAKEQLRTRATDHVATITKALVGAVPGVGSLLAEVVAAGIPQQRMDRVVDFLARLAREVDRLSAAEKLQQQSSMPVIEEGISQAAKAFSEERRAYLAKCVAQGVDADEQDKHRELKILRLIAEVGDDDLILLDALSRRDENSDRLKSLEPPRLRGDATDADRAKGELLRASYRKLHAVGFISDGRYTDEPRRLKSGKYGPEEDGPYISALGRMVLARVGLNPQRP